MPDSLLVNRDAGVTTFTINRPQVRNAVDGPTMTALRAGIEACETDGTRVIVITGAGGAFSSGTDIAVAFAELFIRVGLVPDGGGTWSLPRLIGTGRALELMWTGRTVAATEALHIGLANAVLPTETFADAVQQYAARIAQQAPLALQAGKRAVYSNLDSTFAEALEREAEYQRQIFGSEDGFEGFRAFAEKRPPVWKGR
jgi:2-(1,2-epoxy-1,2-dihydrophenyl)acetyl-CoA isomerase